MDPRNIRFFTPASAAHSTHPAEGPTLAQNLAGSAIGSHLSTNFLLSVAYSL